MITSYTQLKDALREVEIEFGAVSPQTRMQVLQDDGTHRHMRFEPPTDSRRWEVVTWPGAVLLTGARGTWLFDRVGTDDVLPLMRPDHNAAHIDPIAWEFRLGAAGAESDTRTMEYIYDQEKAVALVREAIAARAELKKRPDIVEDADNWIFSAVDTDLSTEIGLRTALARFEGQFESDYGPDLFPVDQWELYECRYAYGYLWACVALPWALKQYEDAKVSV